MRTSENVVEKKYITKIICIALLSMFVSACSGGTDEAPIPPAPGAPTATITLNDKMTDDDQLSQAEIIAGNDIVITGTTGGDVGDGDTVTLTVNSQSYTGNVNNDSFSIAVTVNDLRNDNDLTIDAAVTTSTGSASGEATATDMDSYTVESQITAGITVTSNFTNDTLSQADILANENVTIKGTVSGDVSTGDTVTISINNTTYTATVSNDTYSIDIPVSDFASDSDTTYTVSVTTTTGNSAGEITVTDSYSYTIEPAISANISITAPFTNNLLTQAAINAGGNITVGGTVGGDVGDGDTVIVEFNDKVHTLIVTNSAFSIDIPVSHFVSDSDKTMSAVVTIAPLGGSGIQATDSYTYSIEPAVSATISLDSVFTNNLLTQEAVNVGGNITVTGSVSGDVKDEDVITLSINDKEITTTAMNDTFSVMVPIIDFNNDADKSIEVNVTTSTGNSAGELTVEDSYFYSIEPVVTASVFINDLFSNDLLTQAAISLGEDITVSGQVTGDIAEGDIVTFTINNNDYTSAVANDVFSANIPIIDFQNDSDTTISVSVTTSTGNSAGELTVTDSYFYTIEVAIDPKVGELVDPNRNQDNQFGDAVIVLSNGNIIVSAPNDSSIATGNGAIHLYDGSNRSLIASIYGDIANQGLGAYGALNIKEVGASNFVVSSPLANNNGLSNVGSVRLFNGSTGAQIGVTQYGITSNEALGSGGITVLANGNFVVRASSTDKPAQNGNPAITDAGSYRLIDGDAGVLLGQIQYGNSHMDQIGSGGIYALPNGNYAVSSPEYGTTTLASGQGSVRIHDGNNGNLLYQTLADPNERLGLDGILVLDNSNVVAISHQADTNNSTNTGHMVLINGQTGFIIDVYDGSNLAPLGYGGGFKLNNGNFAVVNFNSSTNGLSNNGTVTLFNGDTGAFIREINGELDNEYLGGSHNTIGVGANNSTFVMNSQLSEYAGVTAAGRVSFYDSNTGNKLVSIDGDTANDRYGDQPTVALSNGYFVVRAKNDTVNNVPFAGSVTLYDEAGVQIGNSLTGSTMFDFIGNSGVFSLVNGNYLVTAKQEDFNSIQNSGTVRLMSGTTGDVISVKSGVFENAYLGDGDVFPLQSGNFVIVYPNVLNSDSQLIDSVKIYDGLTGVVLPFKIETNDINFLAQQSAVKVYDLDNDYFVLSAPLADNGLVDTGFVYIGKSR